jgi:hypothetical protein
MKISQVRAEFFHADGQTDKYNQANSLFFSILRTRIKRHQLRLLFVYQGMPED